MAMVDGINETVEQAKAFDPKEGDRVVISDKGTGSDPLAGRHGVVIKRHASTCIFQTISLFGGGRFEERITSVDWEVRTDAGAVTRIYQDRHLEPEIGDAPPVVPDPVAGLHGGKPVQVPPMALLRAIGESKRKAADLRGSASRRRRLDLKANALKQAEAQDRVNADLRAVWSAWASEHPEAATAAIEANRELAQDAGLVKREAPTAGPQGLGTVRDGFLTIERGQVARLLERNLRRNWPGHLFKVRVDGNCLRVSWTDGPTFDAVRSFCSPYAGERFDSMIDLGVPIGQWVTPTGDVSFRDSPETTGSFGAIDNAAPCAGAVKADFPVRFVFEEREFSVATLREVRAAFGYSDLVIKNEAGLDASDPAWFAYDASLPGQADEIRRHLSGLDLYRAPENAPAIVAEIGALAGNASWKVNYEKNGVELRFADRPADDVLARVKAAGFKWSKFQKVWYAKDTEETRAFAEGLCV